MPSNQQAYNVLPLAIWSPFQEMKRRQVITDLILTLPDYKQKAS